MGTATGPTREFDLSASGLTAARYLKVTGGASLDAAEAFRIPATGIRARYSGQAARAGRPRLEVDLSHSRVFIRAGGSVTGKVFDARGSQGDDVP